ncbi:MAG TPA: hypothetical protein VJM50_23780 [Pyrinomonadaceae bacterium]|nr:hypothetical protein [Pyrinomonadaceae bacterium]
MSDLPDLPPSWPAWVGSIIVGLGFAIFHIRQWLSGANVDRAADSANAATIERLQVAYLNERDRADTLMREREALITNIGKLEAQVLLLTDQVKHLTNEVRRIQPTTGDTTTTQGAG